MQGSKEGSSKPDVPPDPQCECGEECHLRGWCYESSSAKVNAIRAIGECQDEEKSLATVTSSEQVDLLLKIADKIGDDVWVSEKSERLSGECLKSSSNRGIAMLNISFRSLGFLDLLTFSNQ